MHVELHRRLRLALVGVPAGHSHRAVGERHQHAALHDTAPVVMLVLRQEGIAIALAHRLLPERADQADETVVAVGLPAGGPRIERPIERLGVGGLVHQPMCLPKNASVCRRASLNNGVSLLIPFPPQTGKRFFTQLPNFRLPWPSPASAAWRMPMQRTLNAAFLALACLLTDGRPAVSQSPMRFPATGPHAFLITVQPGWTSSEDRANNGMRLFADGRWGGISLSIVTDPNNPGRPLLGLAQEISEAANVKLSGKEEQAAISGKPGTAFDGNMTIKDNTLHTRISIVPVASDTWASLSTITKGSLTPAQQQSLSRAVSNIALTQ